jgi:hypothetical protein
MYSKWKLVAAGAAVFVVGCGAEPNVLAPVHGSEAALFGHPEFSDWSAPERLDINTASPEITPAISFDGLALFFASARAGGLGTNDIWVSRRALASDPWGAPENLGAPVNSVVIEVGPSISLDGRTLLFSSSRPSSDDEVGACGGVSTPMTHCDNDIWQSRYSCDAGVCGWSSPANLGPGVNTSLFEGGQATWGPFIYFNRGGTANVIAGAPDPGPPGDIFASVLQIGFTPGGGLTASYGVAEPVAELNSDAVDQRPAFRLDGLEIFFTSARSGTPDIWVARRRSIFHRWGAPERVAALSGDAQDLHPSLSADGTTIYFASNRAGNPDLYVARRTRIR